MKFIKVLKDIWLLCIILAFSNSLCAQKDHSTGIMKDAEDKMAGIEILKGERLLPTRWDPVAAADKVLENLICVTAPEIKGAHDSYMVLIDNFAYVVYMGNEVRPSENPRWPEIYAALSIVNLNTLKVKKIIPFASSGQVYENDTLPIGSCFVPRIVKKDDNTLRCFFSSENQGKRQSQAWYTDFNLKKRKFENKVYRVKLRTSRGVVDMQPKSFHEEAVLHGFRKEAKDYGLYLFDFKIFDGKMYAVINNFVAGQNSLALANDELNIFEILGHYNEPQTLHMCESAVNRLPDGTWMAICREDKGCRNYLFTISKNGRDWTRGSHRVFVPNGGNSKPTFDYINGIYYLGWQENTRFEGVPRSIFNVDVSVDGVNWERKYQFKTIQSFQYPNFVEHNGKVWLCVTQGDSSPDRKEKIMFGKLEE